MIEVTCQSSLQPFFFILIFETNILEQVSLKNEFGVLTKKTKVNAERQARTKSFYKQKLVKTDIARHGFRKSC